MLGDDFIQGERPVDATICTVCGQLNAIYGALLAWLSQALEGFPVGLFSILQLSSALSLASKHVLPKLIDGNCHQLHFLCWAQVCIAD